MTLDALDYAAITSTISSCTKDELISLLSSMNVDDVKRLIISALILSQSTLCSKVEIIIS